MRRRDATDHHFFLQQRSGWSRLVCTGLSIGLHGLLLGAATLVIVSATRPSELIRVSLISSGRAGGAVSSGPAEAAPNAATVAQPPPPLQPRVRRLPHARIAATKHQTATERRDDSAPPAVAAVASGVADGGISDVGVNGAPGGGGVGQGAGGGNGDGTDQRAACVYCPEPRYPLIARARGWQGRVDVGLLVLADGTVDAASLRRSSGYEVLDAAAVAVARQSRFSPPAAHGLTAPLHGRIEYRFELTDAR
ncbi:MAG TPA: TonB family protein [Candidatus Margulisiibacteriota bacterium]|nr:TonB family protein [Candidatus Margulisiibacteriota bacterium]